MRQLPWIALIAVGCLTLSSYPILADEILADEAKQNPPAEEKPQAEQAADQNAKQEGAAKQQDDAKQGGKAEEKEEAKPAQPVAKPNVDPRHQPLPPQRALPKPIGRRQPGSILAEIGNQQQRRKYFPETNQQQPNVRRQQPPSNRQADQQPPPPGGQANPPFVSPRNIGLSRAASYRLQSLGNHVQLSPALRWRLNGGAPAPSNQLASPVRNASAAPGQGAQQFYPGVSRLPAQKPFSNVNRGPSGIQSYWPLLLEGRQDPNTGLIIWTLP